MVEPWRKVLYVKQDYPDNYLDEKQLKKDLKQNLYTKTHNLSDVMLSSIVVLQEVNSVCLFVGVFWLVEDGTLSPARLFLYCSILAVILLSLLWLIKYSLPDTTLYMTEWLKQSLLFIIFLCGTSPILKTLTESISTDTIYAMTVGMLLTHLVFHNYGTEGPLVSDSFSLNAAMFAAVCLASRLPSSFHTFVIMVFAVILFAIVPKLRNELKISHPFPSLLLTGLLSSITVFTLFITSIFSVLFYIFEVVLILFVCPFWFVKLQYLKNTIHGPWDEAAIKL